MAMGVASVGAAKDGGGVIRVGAVLWMVHSLLILVGTITGLSLLGGGTSAVTERVTLTGASFIGACALGAALYTAVVGWIALSYVAGAYGLTLTVPEPTAFVAIPILVGFVGCQVDSVIGATLERRGVVSKKTNNLISTGTGALLAYGLLVAFGGLTPT